VGVFSKFLPSRYVDSVINSNLKSSVIRDQLRITLELDYLSDEQIRAISGPHDGLIQLKSTFYFTIKNVSGSPISHSIRYHHSNRFSLPDALCGIQSVSIAGRPISSSQTAASRLEEEDVNSVSYAWPVSLKPDEEIQATVEGIVLKEISDNEVWGSVLPTMNCEVVLNSNIPDLTFGIAARTFSKAVERYRSPKNDLYQWEISGPMLPNESLVFWWFPKHRHLLPIPRR
jgi:hypothetical protein